MIADALIPVLMLLLMGAAAWKHMPLYDLFVQGAQEGLRTSVQVLPNLAAMLCAVSLMQSSGLMNALCKVCAPVLALLGLPAEVAPLAIIRPFSGSGALAALQELLETYGPDSRIGLIACTMMGSSETIFYTVSLYMSEAGERKTGYAIPCSLIGMLAGMAAAGMFF